MTTSQHRALTPVVQGVVRLLHDMSSRNADLPKGHTAFHSTSIPPMSISDYMKRIFKYSGCSEEAVVVALILIVKHAAISDQPITFYNIHRTLITAVIVGAKVRDDQYYSNVYYGKIGGIQPHELNSLEIFFLSALHWDMWQDEADYADVLRCCGDPETTEGDLGTTGGESQMNNNGGEDDASLTAHFIEEIAPKIAKKFVERQKDFEVTVRNEKDALLQASSPSSAGSPQLGPQHVHKSNTRNNFSSNSTDTRQRSRASVEGEATPSSSDGRSPVDAGDRKSSWPRRQNSGSRGRPTDLQPAATANLGQSRGFGSGAGFGYRQPSQQQGNNNGSRGFGYNRQLSQSQSQQQQQNDDMPPPSCTPPQPATPTSANASGNYQDPNDNCEQGSYPPSASATPTRMTTRQRFKGGRVLPRSGSGSDGSGQFGSNHNLSSGFGNSAGNSTSTNGSPQFMTVHEAREQGFSSNRNSTSAPLAQQHHYGSSRSGFGAATSNSNTTTPQNDQQYNTGAGQYMSPFHPQSSSRQSAFAPPQQQQQGGGGGGGGGAAFGQGMKQQQKRPAEWGDYYGD